MSQGLSGTSAAPVLAQAGAATNPQPLDVLVREMRQTRLLLEQVLLELRIQNQIAEAGAPARAVTFGSDRRLNPSF